MGKKLAAEQEASMALHRNIRNRAPPHLGIHSNRSRFSNPILHHTSDRTGVDQSVQGLVGLSYRGGERGGVGETGALDDGGADGFMGFLGVLGVLGVEI